MEDPIQLSEIEAVTDTLKTNASPGVNSLMVEFYKKFRNQIAGELQKVSNYVWRKILFPLLGMKLESWYYLNKQRYVQPSGV